MRYRVLGGTGMEVSVHCLGTMMFGRTGNPDHDDYARIVHHALDRGINLVDTADMYSAGSARSSSARRSRADATTLSSPPRCTSRWARA